MSAFRAPDRDPDHLSPGATTLESGLGGIRSAFASRNFRVFWVGNLTHTITVWVNRMAVGWLTWELTHSAAWLGIMAAANMIPIVFLGPVGGVTADRFGHRLQLVTATYIGGVIAAIMAALVAADSLSIEPMLILVTLSGITRAFNVPARIALIHALVERRHLSSAIGIHSATFYGGNFVGPALGGLLITSFGIAPAFFAYAAGELIAATSFLLLRVTQKRAADKRGSGMFEDFLAGFRYTMRHAGILSLMILTAINSVFLQPYMDMLPGFASEVFHRGAGGLALLTSATGAGAMFGGLWVARRGRVEGLVRIQLTALTLGVGAMIAFVATSNLIASMGALFFVGFCLVTAQVCGSTLMQITVASELRARVLSFNGVINASGPALGAICIGWAATKLGLRLPVGASALLALVCLLAAARLVLRNASAMETHGESEPQAAGHPQAGKEGVRRQSV